MLNLERVSVEHHIWNLAPFRSLDDHLSAIGASDWTIVTTMRPNTLVEGTASKTEPIVRALSRSAAAPLRCWDGVPPSPRPATLLLRDVDTLDLREQQALIEWLGDHAGVTRVIATSAVPLFPLVERGLILADLYYRLNIFRLEIS